MNRGHEAGVFLDRRVGKLSNFWLVRNSQQVWRDERLNIWHEADVWDRQDAGGLVKGQVPDLERWFSTGPESREDSESSQTSQR